MEGELPAWQMKDGLAFVPSSLSGVLVRGSDPGAQEEEDLEGNQGLRVAV